MPNDDLGTFPMPPQATSAPNDNAAVQDQTSVLPPTQPEAVSSPTPVYTSPAIPTQPQVVQPMSELTTPPTGPVEPLNTPFEETPEEIPSAHISSPTLESEQDKLVQATEDLIEKQTPAQITPPQIQPQPTQTPVNTPAVLPPKSGSSAAPIIIVILLIVAGIGLAAAAFLSAQTAKLKTQLEEITQTLEKQKTTLTPTATPTTFEIPTPTLTPYATPSGIIATPSATPTVTINSLFPLKNAPSALKVAINRSPNAQLILIKVDNATDPTTAVTKYFFREDLSTKKYFYVAVTGVGAPQIIDKQIYVTPDDNIPSLNDAVLSNSLGLDLDEAVRLSYTQCANQAVCTTAPIKAQYIKTGSGIIWQLSLYTNGTSGTPLMIQIDAETKAIIYKSTEFANK